MLYDMCHLYKNKKFIFLFLNNNLLYLFFFSLKPHELFLAEYKYHDLKLLYQIFFSQKNFHKIVEF